MSELFDDNGAAFSADRKYRYALWRIWDKSKPRVMFIGLNPSTANETQADPTITRVKNFAMKWGYGGFYMMNLFAIVSPYPEVLKTDPDPLGNNDGWLEKIAPECERVVFAWGNFKEATERSLEVIKKFPDSYCLILNKNLTPRHPLYVPATIKPIPFPTALCLKPEFSTALYHDGWQPKNLKRIMNNKPSTEIEFPYEDRS